MPSTLINPFFRGELHVVFEDNVEVRVPFQMKEFEDEGSLTFFFSQLWKLVLEARNKLVEEHHV